MTARNTKEIILEEALDLFSEKGFAATSIRNIAERVGITKGSIYNHFDSKKDIFENLFIIFGPKTVKGILQSEELRKKKNQPYQFFKTYGKLIKELLNTEEEVKLLKIMLLEHNNEIVRKVMKEKFLGEAREIKVSILKEMMEKGLIRLYDPWVLADEFIGSMIFIRIKHLLLTYDEEDLSIIYDQIDKHIEFFWDVIRNR